MVARGDLGVEVPIETLPARAEAHRSLAARGAACR